MSLTLEDSNSQTTHEKGFQFSRNLTIIALVMLVTSAVGSTIYWGSNNWLLKALDMNWSWWELNSLFSIYGPTGEGNPQIFFTLIFEMLAILGFGISLVLIVRHKTLNLRKHLLFGLCVTGAALLFTILWDIINEINFRSLGSNIFATVETVLGIPAASSLSFALATTKIAPTIHEYCGYTGGYHCAPLSTSYVYSYYLFAFMRTVALILIVVALIKLPKRVKEKLTSESDQAAPGWYPDPIDPSKNRYWNGISWQDDATSRAPVVQNQQQPTRPYEQPYAQGVMPSPSTFAMVSLITAFFMPILAVIFGHLAKGEIRRSRGMKTGDGMATAGLILGYLGIAGIILWIVLIVTIRDIL